MVTFSAHPATEHLNKRYAREHGRPERLPLGNPVRTFILPIDPARLSRATTDSEAASAGSNTHAALQRRRWPPRSTALRVAAWRGRQLARWVRYDALRSGARGKDGWTVRRTDCIDDRIDDLFRAAATEFDFIQIRDAALLNWRYLDRRAGPFTVLVAEQDQRLLGYAAVLLAGARSDVADLLVLPGRTDVLHSLLREVVALARASGAAGMQAWLPARHPYAGALQRAGFYQSRAPGIGQTRLASHEIDGSTLVTPQARVHLMLGDSDHI
jgi:hypothetical protein